MGLATSIGNVLGGAGNFLGAAGSAALSIFSPAASVVAPVVKASTVVPGAIGNAGRAIQTQASSLFQNVSSAAQKIFTTTPIAQSPAAQKKSLGSVFEDIIFSTSDILLGKRDTTSGQRTGGLISDILTTRPPATDAQILTVPAAQPPPGTVAGILQQSSQPVGMYSVGFPAPPPSQTNVSITSEGTPAPATSIPWLWIILALLLIALFMLNRK